MSSSTTEIPLRAQDVTVTKDALTVELLDGRSISAPLAWYPRLLHGTPEERSNWRLVGQGVGIHWPELDEDISVENLLAGRASGESQRSLKQWLSQRASSGEHLTVHRQKVPAEMNTKQNSDNLDRDQQFLNRLAKIEHKADSIDQTLAFSLRVDKEKHFDSVKGIFGRSKRRAQVYLAADGTRSVQDIADHLGMKRQNVGIELGQLSQEGLLEIIDSQGNKDLWAKKPVDRTLRISQFLQKEFNLKSNGLPET
jgi:hypothetical protein